MRFAQLEGKRVAVWGCGREGRAALAALHRRLPELRPTLFCSASEAAQLPADAAAAMTVHTASPDAAELAAFDIVIKSPGISAYKPEIVAAQAEGTLFTSGTALWFGENPEARVVGITGTKGKSTTSAMLAHLARALGVRTALAGNIGLPLLELDGQQADLWVVELSSFQTGDTGPLELGIITSLYEEHLDWHGSRERYVADKLKLADQSRTLLVNATQPLLLQRTASHPYRVTFGDADGWHVALEPSISGKTSRPSFPRTPESSVFEGFREAESLDSRVRGNDEPKQAVIRRADEPVLPLSALTTPGAHNALNACAALAALEQLGLDAHTAAQALPTFRPLPHRLQSLGERDGITWINDSIGTTPPATLAALDSLAGRHITLILGGHDRGLDWSGFVHAIANRPGLAVITQGANGPRIADALRSAKSTLPLHEVADLEAAVMLARRITAADGTVLLSPGAPSFDQFHDYTERGRRFADLAGFDGAAIAGIQDLGIA